ncbi:TonB-dependent receptor [soil metagenome]
MRVETAAGLLLAGALALAAPVAAVQAQQVPRERSGSISGVVRDGAGRPLANVRLVLLPVQREAESGSDGRFELRQLSGGVYRLEASLIGYAPQTRTLELSAGGTTVVALDLAATPLTLSGLQVTASPGARLPTAVTQATAQLSGKSLDREMGGSVAQTLKYQPGIAVRSMGPGASMPVIRGLTGDRVLMLQDGQRTADMAGSADDHGVTIDPLAAQRVEVVRGPATLLYGNNALGGVVNVISGDVSGGLPLRPELAVSAQAETAYPGGAVTVRGTAPVGEAWAVTARAGVRHSGDMRIPADPRLGSRLANTQSGSWNGSAAVSRLAPSWSASLAVRAYSFAYGLPVPPDAEPVELRGDRGEVAGRVEVGLPGLPLFSGARLDFTVQDYSHDELGEDGVVAQRFALRTGSAGVLLGQGGLGPFRDGAWGVSLLLKDYDATGPDALTPAATSKAAGIFGFQEIGLGGGSAALQLGGRFDRYAIDSRTSVKFGSAISRTFDAFSGSAGMNVPLVTGVTTGLTVSQSFRAPTVEELFSAAPHAGTGSVEFGDASLREERGRSVEAVLHVSTTRVNGQLSAYLNRVDDFVQLAFARDTVIGNATLPVYVYAQSPATLRGVEGSMEVALHRHIAAAWRGDWLYTTQPDGSALSFMPPPRLGMSLRWDDATFSLGGDAHHEFAQRRTGRAEETPTDAHTILRVESGVRIRAGNRPHALSLRIDNLTNSEHREATSRTRDFAPAAGRNVSLLYRTWF